MLQYGAVLLDSGASSSSVLALRGDRAVAKYKLGGVYGNRVSGDYAENVAVPWSATRTRCRCREKDTGILLSNHDLKAAYMNRYKLRHSFFWRCSILSNSAERKDACSTKLLG